MNTLWIAANYLKILAKDKKTYLLLLLLPAVLSIIFGMASTPQTTGKLAICVVDNDDSEVSAYLSSALKTDTFTIIHTPEETAREMVETRQASAAVIIPPDLQQTIINKTMSPITILRADLTESPGLAEQHITAVLNRLRTTAAIATIAATISDRDWQQAFIDATATDDQPKAVAVDLQTVTAGEDIPLGHNQSWPGMTVFFAMMTVIVVGAGTLLFERDHKTLARLYCAPVTKLQIIGGKMLGIIASGMIQMGVLITVSTMVFGVNWGHLPSLVLLVFALSFASTGIGMVLASATRSKMQAESIGSLVVILMALIGGCWWPLEVMPAYMQTLAKAVPSGWAISAFSDLIIRSADLQQVSIPIVVLFAFGTVFTLISAMIMRKRPLL